MGDIVNLRRARKARARQAAESEAGAQRLLHGRTKTGKRAEEVRLKAAERHLDGHRREAPPTGALPKDEQGQ